MRHFSVYVLYRAASAFLRALPLPGIFRLGQILGFCAWLILPGYRRLALRNASIAFGREGSARSLRRVVRRHFQLLGANLLSSIKITTMPVDELEGRTRINNLEVIHQHLRAGRPVVVILSHIGNWELLAQLWPKFIGSVRNGTVYQRLSNPWIDRHVRQLRSRSGVELFDRKEGFQKAIDLLRSGGVIGILSDQHAGDHGLWVPFFGKLASTTPLPALLAKRTSAVVVGIAVYTEGTARWRIDISSAIETSGQSVESLTFKANEVIEAQIRHAPEDWFWVHDRWKTPRPNLLLTKYKRGVYLPPAMSSDQLKPFRILIRTSNWLGDAVMSAPAVRAIKHGRPDAHVTILAPQNLAPIWKLIPEVDEIVSAGTSSLFSTVRSIRRHSRFDAAVLFPNSLRVALEVWLGGVPRRIGYRGHSRAWLLNQIVRKRGKPGPLEHQSLHYLRIAQNLGAEVDGTSPSLPDEFPVDTATAAVNNGPVNIGLCPGAEYGPAKRWLPERFGEVAAQIGAERNVQWLLFGTSKDAAAGENIQQTLGDKCSNRIGKTTLQQLINELRECRLLLTNDTGTMHLASLLGVPTVAIFGSTEPGLTGPLGKNHLVLRHHVECSPCFLRKCPIDFRCMKAVTVAEVAAAVLSVLDRPARRSTESSIAALSR